MKRLPTLPCMCLTLVITVPAAGATWHVPGDAPTIQAGINAASAGDDVLVAPGEYLEHDIVMKAGIWVHSEQGAEATTVDAASAGRGFDSAGLQQDAIIEGFRIVHGLVESGEYEDREGGGLRCRDSRMTIRDCLIEDCSASASGGGILVQNSTILIEGCTVRNCTAYQGGGIWAPSGCRLTMTDTVVTDNDRLAMWADGPEVTILRCVFARNIAGFGNPAGLLVHTPALTIEDCLFVDNRNDWWGGITSLTVVLSSGTISGCTVARNALTSENAAVSIIDSNIGLNRIIIAFHEGSALECSGTVTVRCCDFYGNTTGNAVCGNDLGGNISADPLFCDAANDGYTLDARSPCLPGNHPDGVDCGLIGALGQGCSTPLTGACCFVDGSCLVLGQSVCGDQGGTYQGDGTTCDPNPCEPTPVQPTTWGRIKASYR